MGPPVLLRNPAASYSPRESPSQVPSALEGLTSVFGMGTGVTPPQSPPKPCAVFNQLEMLHLCGSTLWHSYVIVKDSLSRIDSEHEQPFGT